MGKRSVIIFALIAVALLAALPAFGCGGDTEVDLPDLGDIQVPSEDAGDEFNQKIEDLKKKEMTVEVIEDGESLGEWSQNGKGSWRSDDPEDEDVYTIFNEEENKLWSVNGTSVTELDPSFSDAYELANPILLLSAYSAFAFLPRTGGSDDAWEWDVPGAGKLRIEFEGPDGLISKVISEDDSTSDSEIEFKYSNIDNVPDSKFELPDDVDVSTVDFDGGTLTGTSTSFSPDFGE